MQFKYLSPRRIGLHGVRAQHRAGTPASDTELADVTPFLELYIGPSVNQGVKKKRLVLVLVHKPQEQ